MMSVDPFGFPTNFTRLANYSSLSDRVVKFVLSDNFLRMTLTILSSKPGVLIWIILFPVSAGFLECIQTLRI